jgi:glycosyltransferase involved in cell wall biosynthesis
MTERTPLISVSMVAHNHEKYIAEAIDRVRRQTVTDWELVIVDDGSVDATAERIRAFDDPRIISIVQDNQGPGAATNRAIAASRGKYLALMSGDDRCYPDRLEAQLRTYVAGERRVLFGEVELIDDAGAIVDREHFASSLFETATRTRPQTLERFFSRGNFLNGVTVFTEREVFLEAGPYDRSLFQLQDFDMWIRLLKKYELSTVPGRVTQYRIHGRNLSRPRIASSLRSASELYVIMRRFFDDVPLELFHEAFDHQLIDPTCSDRVQVQCEQAFLYLKSHFKLNQLIGIERLHDLLQSPDTAGVLEERYGFTSTSFALALTSVDVTNQFGALVSRVYVDTGNGFNEEQRVQALPQGDAPEFRLTFDLRGFGPVRALRWDPLEGYWCSVRLTGGSCSTSDGRSIVLDLTKVQSNGAVRADGTVVFETFDPGFVLPIEGDVATLILEGEWERSETPQLIASLEARFRETSQREKEEVESAWARRLQDEESALKASCQRELASAASEHELRIKAKQTELEEVASAYERQLDTTQAELERVAAEYRERLEANEAELHRVAAEYQRLSSQKQAELHRAVADYQRLLNQKQAELQRVVAEYEERRSLKQAELETILHSRSWRMTAPLRALRRRLTRRQDV